MRHIDIGQRAQGAHERGGRLSGNAHNNAHTDVVQVKLVEEEQRILNAYGVEEAVECDELRGLETVDKQLNAVDGTLPARERRHTDGVGKRHQRGLAARLAAEGALIPWASRPRRSGLMMDGIGPSMRMALMLRSSASAATASTSRSRASK